jgi:hypothetical protein
MQQKSELHSGVDDHPGAELADFLDRLSPFAIVLALLPDFVGQ